MTEFIVLPLFVIISAFISSTFIIGMGQAAGEEQIRRKTEQPSKQLKPNTMKITIKVDTQNDFEIKEAEILLENFLLENKKRELKNKEENLQFSKRFNEWADGFFNPKHEKPLFGDQILVSELMKNFEKEFGLKTWSNRILLKRLKSWADTRNLIFDDTMERNRISVSNS